MSGIADERLETIARLAGLPARRTLEDFDFVLQGSIHKKQVAELASCAFVERAENVVLLGPPGVGKMYLAIALGLAAAGRRYSVKFTTAARMVATLVEACGAGSFTRRLSSFCRPRLLIVDEVGFLPLEAEGAAGGASRPRTRRARRPSATSRPSTMRAGATRDSVQRAPPSTGRCWRPLSWTLRHRSAHLSTEAGNFKSRDSPCSRRPPVGR